MTLIKSYSGNVVPIGAIRNNFNPIDAVKLPRLRCWLKETLKNEKIDRVIGRDRRAISEEMTRIGVSTLSRTGKSM